MFKINRIEAGTYSLLAINTSGIRLESEELLPGYTKSTGLGLDQILVSINDPSLFFMRELGKVVMNEGTE